MDEDLCIPVPDAASVKDPDWNGHYGVGGSITGPRSVPDQGGEVTQSSSSIAGYRVCASEVLVPLAHVLKSPSCISWVA